MSIQETVARHNDRIISRGLPTEPPRQAQDDRSFDEMEMWNSLNDRERQRIVDLFIASWSEDFAFEAMGGGTSGFDAKAIEFRNKQLSML